MLSPFFWGENLLLIACSFCTYKFFFFYYVDALPYISLKQGSVISHNRYALEIIKEVETLLGH